MKLARFTATVYAAGVPQFEAGKHYRISDETVRQVALGNAEEVDVQVDLGRAEKLALRAKEAVAKAEDSARLAAADLAAAQEAQRLVLEAEAAIAAGEEATTDRIQREQADAAQLVDHAKKLQEQADAAVREAEAAEGRAAADPANQPLADLAKTAREQAGSLRLQADEATLAATAAADAAKV